MNKKKVPLFPFLLLLFVCVHTLNVSGQFPGDIIPERIAVSARPSPDSITLRWAPLNFNVWQSGNLTGYRIERYVMARDGNLLARAERSILVHSLKPLPAAAWETLVHTDRYGAIAAQALFGASFEVDLQQSDVFTIVNKVKENEQRFAFALFSADMSPQVARASGLWFSDTQIKKGEKYLYRVVVNSLDSLRGSVFISGDELQRLPEPKNVKAEFKEQLVTLRWNRDMETNYTAYLVERSHDGIHFTSIADTPLVTVSPTEVETRYEYAIDSLGDLTKTYHYRIKGITPFGEQSPPSRIVTGKATPAVTQVPFISSTENRGNISIVVRWDFPHTNDHAIKGFDIERSGEPKGRFIRLTEKLISSDARAYEDGAPQQVNYYRVTAHGLDGERYPSHVYFTQLVDSVPPTNPQGLKAQIDDEGNVSLSWNPNTESDIFGYRVYKAFHQSEEFAQITRFPIPDPLFTDTVDLNTLNENIYYRIMAVDINQNHSSLSGLLKVPLPDKVKPQAPVFLPVKATNNGITLTWLPGGSEDIVQYEVYRKSPAYTQWELLKIVPSRSDTLYQFTDVNIRAGDTNFYTIIAIDDAGLESEPAGPVTGNRINSILQPVITWKRPQINREESQITLTWNYNQPEIEGFRIFRSVDDEPPILFMSIAGDKKEFTDRVIPGQRYAYRIMALFPDGQKSMLSEAMEFQY